MLAPLIILPIMSVTFRFAGTLFLSNMSEKHNSPISGCPCNNNHWNENVIRYSKTCSIIRG